MVGTTTLSTTVWHQYKPHGSLCVVQGTIPLDTDNDHMMSNLIQDKLLSILLVIRGPGNNNTIELYYINFCFQFSNENIPPKHFTHPTTICTYVEKQSSLYQNSEKYTKENIDKVMLLHLQGQERMKKATARTDRG